MSISKELLSEVLQKDLSYILDPSMIISIYKVMGSGSILRYTIKRSVSNNHESINIHELAHKCKEWALDNGYEFVEDINVNRHSIRIYNCGILVYEKFENYRLSPSDTFKACQWILDNKETR